MSNQSDLLHSVCVICPRRNGESELRATTFFSTFSDLSHENLQTSFTDTYYVHLNLTALSPSIKTG